MTPIDHPALEDLHQRTTAMLTAIDDTPLERIDHGHYPHYYEELRLLVEEWLTATSATPRPAGADLGHHPPRGRGGRVHDRHRRCPDRWDP
jgi:hypothetical protein